MKGPSPHSLRRRNLAADDRAIFNIGDSTKTVGIIIGAVLTMLVVAALFGDFTGAVRDVNDNLTTADFGEDTTNQLAPVFAIVVGLTALAGIVGLILARFQGGRLGGD